MNIILKALDEIKFRIPMQVLVEAFKDDVYSWRRAPISLDEQMLAKIIRPRVLVDCNLVGGQTANIPLEGILPEFMDTYTSIYHIDKARTQNRTIISALSVGYMPFASAYNSTNSGYGTVSPSSMNAVSGAAQRVGDSVSGIPPVSNAYVELIAENTILLRDQNRVTSAYFLRCILANEETLNNISPRSYLAFSKLCELAVKAYIYNKMIIKIDQAFLQGGQELGSMKNYVESLSDAGEMYITHLREVWQVTALCNDTHTYDRLLKLMVNPAV